MLKIRTLVTPFWVNPFCKSPLRPKNLIIHNRLIFKHTKAEEKLKISNEDSCTGLTVDNVIKRRFEEASRTILVQTTNGGSIDVVTQACEEYGSVNNIFQYKSPYLSEPDFFLVEYETELALKNVHTNAMMPPRSNTLTQQEFNQLSGLRSYSMVYSLPLTKMSSSTGRKSRSMQKPALNLTTCTTVDHQIEEIHNKTKLTEISLRLRFLTCYQVQKALQGLYPDVNVIPFGSTINSFGTNESDLDASIILNDDNIYNNSPQHNNLGLQHNFNGSLFAHHNDSKNAHKMLLNNIGDIIKIHLPHCVKILKVMHARVPIIKYNQIITGMGCDLSLQSKSGVYMSELLHTLGHADERVIKLVATVKLWCKQINLNPSSDTQRISNFAITLMVLFYLMRTDTPVIPTVNELIRMSRPEDKRMLPEGIDCTFLRDASLIPPSENTQSMTSLLLGFFEFYSKKFNFKQQGICLLTAQILNKPKKSGISLYIRNPQDINLNVTANVTLGHVEELKLQLSRAHQIMSFIIEKDFENNNGGILKLLNKRERCQVNVQDLFND